MKTGGCVAGVQLDGEGAFLNGLIEAPQFGEHEGEIVVQGGPTRVDLDGLDAVFQGGGGLTLFVEDFADVTERLIRSGIQSESLAVADQRVLPIPFRFEGGAQVQLRCLVLAGDGDGVAE